LKARINDLPGCGTTEAFLSTTGSLFSGGVADADFVLKTGKRMDVFPDNLAWRASIPGVL
jgi:hypothetical protein